MYNTEVFTQTLFTQTFLHTEAFTHRHLYTQKLLHTDALTHRHLDTEHTETFKQTLLHKRFYTDAFKFYTQKLSHTAHRGFVHTEKIPLLLQFLAIEPRFVRKGCGRHLEIAFFPQFLAIEPRFVRKGCGGHLQIAILRQFLAIEPPVVRKGCGGHLQIAILRQFLVIEPHFVRKGCAGRLANSNFTSVFGDRTSFRAKGLRGTTWESQFYRSFWRSNLVSCERVAFRAVSLALPLPHAPAFRREIEKKERARARGQEEKM